MWRGVRLGSVALIALAVVACGSDDDPATAPVTAGATTSTEVPPAPSERLILEMRELTGENLFARFVYFCGQCTRGQFDAIEVPEGWQKGTGMQQLPEIELLEPPTFEGVTSAMDFVEEIPGDEFTLVAKVTGGQLLGVSATGPMAIAQVARSTVFTYPAGSVVHEVIDGEGHRYVLFAVALELIDQGHDPAALDAFADLELPDGWRYESHTLDQPLTIDSDGLATVFTHSEQTTWQRNDT